MGKMMKYFEEQMKGVTDREEPEMEYRLILVNVDNAQAMECNFEDSMSMSMFAHAVVVLSGPLPEIQKEGPNIICIGLEEEQIHQVMEGFQTTEAPNEQIALIAEALVDSLRSIL
ncbi:MAG: hypothetical protein K9K88_06675 [Desulfobacterales bacterium]|nr:hypothetical protein [Desulfobacterales bacterium]